MQFFRNTSIKARLTSAFIVTILLPCIVIVSTSFFTAEKQIRNEQILNAQNTLDLVDGNISKLVEEKILQIEYFSEAFNASLFEEAEASLFPAMDQYLATNMDTLIAYIGTKDGVMLRRPYFEYDSSYNPTERNWYKDAANAPNETIISDPYISASTGELVITISRLLSDKSGVVGIDLSIQTIADIANAITIGKSGYFTIIDRQQNEITSNFKDLELKNETLFDYINNEPNLTNVSTSNEFTHWQIVATVDNNDAQEVALSTLNINILIVIVCLVISGIMVFLIIRSITVPLLALNKSTERISQGDLTVRVDVNRKDELGTLSNNFNEMRDSLHLLISQVNDNTTIVKQAAEQLFESTNQSIQATTESAVALQKVAENNEQQLANNESINHFLQTIGENSADISQHSSNTAKIANTAISNANLGNETVQQTVQQMKEIDQAVSASDLKIHALTEKITNIDSIVDMINAIANQTNLLALNASIEAARAGEHGKGFAVVANEVKTLAESSKKSTEQITALIQAIHAEAEQLISFMTNAKNNVSDGMNITQQSAMKFVEILDDLQSVTPYMNQIVNATLSMQQTVDVSEKISHEAMLQAKENASSSEEVAAASEEIHASMEHMNYSANQLQKMADELQQLVQKFKI